MLINDKTTGDVYEASEFTQFKNETQNAITSGGEPLSASDVAQLSKRITLAAAHDNFYSSSYDTGTDTYQLVGPASRGYPYEYKIGLKVRFIVSADNDANDAYVKLGSLDALKVSSVRLANGESPVLGTGFLKQYDFADLIYEETPDGLTKYWLTCKSSLASITSGNTAIEDSLLKITDTANSIDTNHGRNGFSVASANQSCTIQTYGINYIDSAISSLVTTDRTLAFSFSPSWTLDSNGYYATVNILTNDTYTGPSTTPYIGSVAAFYLDGTTTVVIPVTYMELVDDGFGKIKIQLIYVSSTFNPSLWTSNHLYLRSSAAPPY